MPSSDNRVLIACAGSGKTTRLVNEALADRTRRIAIITYTNNNAKEIAARFAERYSGVPPHVNIMTWFGFLLRECARPYQRAKYPDKRIESLHFVNERSTRYVKETDTERYYFAGGDRIFSDKIAQFVVACNGASRGALIDRLKLIYTDIFLDEFQDLAGWDHEVIALLLKSGIRITMVGDPRQHIYSTNPSAKNRQFLGAKVVGLIGKWEASGLCSTEAMNLSYRCNPPICEFVNRMWPGLDRMEPGRETGSDHEGVFLVSSLLAREYVNRYDPQVLRYDKRADDFGCDAMNFGIAKGLEFKRALIVPTGTMRKYLTTGNVGDIGKSKDKLHVAATRATHSVAFVHDGRSPLIRDHWEA